MKVLCKQRLNKRLISLCSVLLLIALVLGSSTPALSQEVGDGSVVRMIIARRSIRWEPLVEHGGIELIVSGPGEAVYSEVFGPNAVPIFRLIDASGDGLYRYELRVLPVNDGDARPKVEEAQRGLVDTGGGEAIVLWGSFTILDGRFVTPTQESEAEDGPSTPDAALAPSDVLHYDDVIITGSLCVGFDCQDGESFGFDTVILKEHNLRIYFNDTSYTASYPTNNWRITINDSTNGGASYFSVDDVDDGTSIFKIEAGAPSNSLYVEDYGRVGFGTSTPVVEAHIKDSDTPTIRLEQDSSGGWTAQTFDIGSNESNFFVRDATNGSKLPFRIQPSTPSSTLCLKNDGKVGIGTWSPSQTVEVETTNENAVLLLDRTDGARFKMTAGLDRVMFGSETNHGLQILVNNTPRAELNSSGDLTITGDLTASSCNCSSDVNAKENFDSVDGKEVLAQLGNVEITTWNFKADDDSVRHMGPTAQDFYAAYGLGADDTHINTVDAAGVTLVAIKELNAQNEALQAENAALEARLTALEQAAGLSSEPQVSFLSLLPWILVGVLLVGIGALGGFVLAMHKQLGRAKS